MTLYSKLGAFIFESGTNMRHAKLVRDTVMGQVFNPKPGSKRLVTLNDCFEFMKNHESKVLAAIPFEIALR